MTPVRLRNGIQNFLSEAGEAACYALCLIDVAEEFTGRHIDIADALINAIDRNYIIYKWEDRNFNDNFFVQYPALFLEMLTGKKWQVTKEPSCYTKKEGEYVIYRWERVQTGKTTGHFNRIDFEPYLNSITVQHGSVVSLRVYKVLNP